MPLDLTDEETAALERLLSDTITGDRYPLSPRILTLKAILAKIRPEPVRKPLPPARPRREAMLLVIALACAAISAPIVLNSAGSRWDR